VEDDAPPPKEPPQEPPEPPKEAGIPESAVVDVPGIDIPAEP